MRDVRYLTLHPEEPKVTNQRKSNEIFQFEEGGGVFGPGIRR